MKSKSQRKTFFIFGYYTAPMNFDTKVKGGKDVFQLKIGERSSIESAGELCTVNPTLEIDP